MDKKYTVFVSSTYEDLKEERQEVMQALLEIDCIPCGMELFPASDDEQFEFIKRVIDDCDYYILILAGRYGSTNKEGIGYTELEYRYALEKNIPILSFVHADVSLIPNGRCEQNKVARKKLEEFRKLAEKKLCKKWKSGEELSGIVSRSMINFIKMCPATGWVRMKQVSYEETLYKMTQLYEENRKLKNNFEHKEMEDSAYAQGDEQTKIIFRVYRKGFSDIPLNKFEVQMSWDDIFRMIGPVLIEGESRYAVEKKLEEFGKTYLVDRIGINDEAKSFFEENYLEVFDDSVDDILVQFMALGYIEVHHHNSEMDVQHDSTFVLSDSGQKKLFKLAARRKVV